MLYLLRYDLSKEQRNIILLSSLGGLLEFYDFTIYGLFAVYFASQFFPSHDNFASIMASYSVFVVGYIVRPIGGIIFSHIGDEIGRKIVLIITMFLMGVASLGMAFLPTYEQIGIYAPILMLLFRLIQGLAIGGELPSMIVYVAESMPNKRGYGMGGIFSGTVAGLIPGMLINLLIVKYLTPLQINSFGWRVPFLIGGLLCFVAYKVRRELHETVVFKNIIKHDNLPLITVLKTHFLKVLIGIALVAIMATPIILAIIFMPTYLTKIAHIDQVVASDAVLIASLISTIAIYLCGILANKYSPYNLMRILLVLIVIAGGVCYYLISLKVNLILGLAFFAIFQGALVVLPPLILSYLFPPEVRLSGVALSYNLGFVLFGGLSPVIITYFIEKTAMLYTVPVLFLAFSALLAYWGLVKSKKYIY